MSQSYDIEECPNCGDPDNPHIERSTNPVKPYYNLSPTNKLKSELKDRQNDLIDQMKVVVDSEQKLEIARAILGTKLGEYAEVVAILGRLTNPSHER